MGAEANPVPPEINREKFLAAIRKIFIAEESSPEEDVLQNFAQKGITPQEVDQILQELNLPDKELRSQFPAAVQETSKKRRYQNIINRIPGLQDLTAVFNTLNKNAGELAPEFAELRWQIRFQLALLLKSEVIRGLEAFLKEECFRDRVFRFNQLGPAIAAFINTNRGTRDPRVVLPEILAKQSDIDELLSRPHKLGRSEKITAGSLVLIPKSRFASWQSINEKIYNTELDILAFKAIVATFESQSKKYPELNRILPDTHSKKKIVITAEEFPRIKQELELLEVELSPAATKKMNAQKMPADVKNFDPAFAQCALSD
ncbi:MAG: hypothetical protein ABIH35_02275 [Patescibacteria group bacterium]